MSKEKKSNKKHLYLIILVTTEFPSYQSRIQIRRPLTSCYCSNGIMGRYLCKSIVNVGVAVNVEKQQTIIRLIEQIDHDFLEWIFIPKHTILHVFLIDFTKS